MAYRLFGAKHSFEPMMEYFQLNKLQRNFNWNFNIFIHENSFENVVCEIAAILSRWKCVNGFLK